MADQHREALRVLSRNAPLLTFDFPTLVQQIKSEDAWHKGERNATPLFNTERMRVVLMALRAGAALSSHRADGPIMVQVIEGCIRFTAELETVTLTKGQMLTLEAGLPHAVEAREESVFLLSVAPLGPVPPQQ